MSEDVGILARIAGWLLLGYALAIAGFCLWGVWRTGEAEGVLFSLVLIPWIAAPVAGAAAAAGASPTRIGAAAFLALEAALILFTIWLTVDVYRHGNSTSGIAFLFLPVGQWGAFGIVFLLALLFGWRMRPDFLKG
ncbi:MAG: hypothetical protein QOJ53_1339 [Sphingomonadales bacterium]|jgi:hypothetical protein|nr:hypothetical protein [Sphingomonadales bacterium]